VETDSEDDDEEDDDREDDEAIHSCVGCRSRTHEAHADMQVVIRRLGKLRI
jgi:hypothetical protein